MLGRAVLEIAFVVSVGAWVWVTLVPKPAKPEPASAPIADLPHLVEPAPVPVVAPPPPSAPVSEAVPAPDTAAPQQITVDELLKKADRIEEKLNEVSADE